MHPLDSFPSWSLHCTVRLCQPVSHVLEQVIHVPVTHCGPGAEVEGPGVVAGPGTRIGGAEDVVVLLVVVVVVETVVVVLCVEVNFRLGLSGAGGCCGGGAVRLGMKKL